MADLDTILNEVDYRGLESYKPSLFAIKFVEFIKLVNDGKPENRTPVFHYKLIDTLVKNVNTLGVVFRGGAKALDLNTPVMTPSGYVAMRDIHVGDYVIDRLGKPAKVIHESEIFHNRTYRITLSNGSEFIASEDHLHVVEKKSTGGKWVERVMSTKEIIEAGVHYREGCQGDRQKKWAIPRCKPDRKYATGNRVMISDIVETESPVPTKCIGVDSWTHTYLIEDSIITHNTSLVEYMILYIAVFGQVDGLGDTTLGMYVGDTMENGVKNMRNNLEFRYNNSDFLKKYIPKVKFTDPEWEFVNAEGHEFTVRGYGISTGVRGFKKYGIRPQIAWLDDLMSDKNAESKTVTNDIEQVIYKAIRQAMHPRKRRIIWIGTPFNLRDPLYKAAGTATWSTVAFPVCEKWPCTREEFRGAWEDRFDYDFVSNEYAILRDNGKIDAFNQELMLRIISAEERLVKDEDIVWFSRTRKLANLANCNVYITTDFATSETEKSDYSVISVWALDSKGVFNWIDGVVKRQDMARNVDDLFRFVDVYNPLSVGVEISGQQKGFVSWIRREMNLRNRYFMLATDKASGEEGLRPNTSKLTRFNVALPLFRARKIAFPEELKDSPAMQEFMIELMSVTAAGFKSQHDDCADTISQIPLMEYFVPNTASEAEPVKQASYSKYFYAEPEESPYRNGPYIV